MEEYRPETDYLAEDPRSWYQGPLIFFEEPEERFGEGSSEEEKA